MIQDFVKKIRAFQREMGLKADGMLGPGTFRRLVAHREAQEEYEKAQVEIQPGEKAILYKGKKFPIKWDKVILPSDPGGMEHDNGYSPQTASEKLPVYCSLGCVFECEDMLQGS